MSDRLTLPPPPIASVGPFAMAGPLVLMLAGCGDDDVDRSGSGGAAVQP